KIMSDAYVAGGDPHAPLASPLYADLTGLPPILIHVGDSETLLDDSIRFAERARAAGVDIEVDVWPEMIHVWHAFAPMLPEATVAIAKLAEFIKAKTA
ncbi:MAG: alpha/beta hydrolase fold domain-containing protein, partial [Actinobacteria bacterium]|nr:alpha/beta hydrolase fold domain-containing protein [Actinomycetota bacterium]